MVLSDVQDWYVYNHETARCKRGFSGKTFAIAKGDPRVLLYPRAGNLWQSKTYKLELTFVKACSDLWATHQRKCKEWQKEGFLVA
jgi:hypothetical protein